MLIGNLKYLNDKTNKASKDKTNKASKDKDKTKDKNKDKTKTKDKASKDKDKNHKLSKDFSARVVYENPYIVKINNLLDDDEISELLLMARYKFEPSNLIVDGKLVYNTDQRRSSTAYIFKDGLPDRYSKPVEKFIKKILYLTGAKRNQLEIMAVKYKKGEYFDKHVDYLNSDEIGEIDNAGNRIATFFIYLNTLQKTDGGETEFTKIGLKSRPKKGDALFWYNQNIETGKMIPETQHRGLPVLNDNVIKFGLNVWIRSHSF